MKLSNLYKGRVKFPIVTLVLAITCIIVSVPTYFDNRLYAVMSSWTHPHFFWQYFSGTFEHGHGFYHDGFLLVHLGLNLATLILLGLMIEKMLGSSKMLLLNITALIINIIAFQTYYANIYPYAGASGVFYSYGPIAFYMIIKVFLANKKAVWVQPLWYIHLCGFSFMCIYLLIFHPGYAHTIGFIVGIVFLFIWRKTINNEVDSLISEKEKECQETNKWYNVLWLLPLGMMIIIILYWMGYILQNYR